jgi:hypothetical protein
MRRSKSQNSLTHHRGELLEDIDLYALKARELKHGGAVSFDDVNAPVNIERGNMSRNGSLDYCRKRSKNQKRALCSSVNAPEGGLSHGNFGAYFLLI